ncbi:MAG: BufA2 family periplasmic bufferin-type metallophore [Gammaproteobacteria bacterium]
MYSKTMTGVLLATAAAALFSTANISAATDAAAAPAQVKCSGVNACKGLSECASASNACKGQNSCKGHGWMHMAKADCDAKGGKVIEEPKK